MKRALKIVGAILGGVILALASFYGWASLASSRSLSRTFETHAVDFPIPFPLSDQERRTLRLTDEQAQQVARERALERGKHLVESRFGCTECHGMNLGGGVMVDAPIIGRLLGPNITGGEGSRTIGYRPSDWDRIMRHGVRPDGTPGAMPAEDFQNVSDQELSDVIVYVQSFSPVNHVVPPVKLGPLGKVLLATGQLPLSADHIASHNSPHATYPPAAEVTVEFGRHLAAGCMGCHRQDLAGGPIVGGDPSWAPARNLTPHATGLAGWTYQQFVTAMREGKRPDGSALLPPMDLMPTFAQKMTDTELQALWMFLQSVPPVPSRP